MTVKWKGMWSTIVTVLGSPWDELINIIHLSHWYNFYIYALSEEQCEIMRNCRYAIYNSVEKTLGTGESSLISDHTRNLSRTSKLPANSEFQPLISYFLLVDVNWLLDCDAASSQRSRGITNCQPHSQSRGLLCSISAMGKLRPFCRSGLKANLLRP